MYKSLNKINSNNIMLVISLTCILKKKIFFLIFFFIYFQKNHVKYNTIFYVIPYTLYIGYIKIHPIYLYSSIILYILSILHKKLKVYYTFYFKITILSLGTGSFWGLSQNLWGFLWVGDIIEILLFILVLNIFITLHNIHTYMLYVFNYVLVTLTLYFILIFLRLKLIKTRHFFFNKLEKKNLTLIYFCIICIINLFFYFKKINFFNIKKLSLLFAFFKIYNIYLIKIIYLYKLLILMYKLQKIKYKKNIHIIFTLIITFWFENFLNYILKYKKIIFIFYKKILFFYNYISINYVHYTISNWYLFKLIKIFNIISINYVFFFYKTTLYLINTYLYLLCFMIFKK